MTYKRRDLGHQTIRDGLRAIGYHVVDLADNGRGVPDLLVVSRQDTAVLLEVKSPGEKLTEAETLFHAAYKAPLRIVYSLEEALEILWNIDQLPY